MRFERMVSHSITYERHRILSCCIRPSLPTLARQTYTNILNCQNKWYICIRSNNVYRILISKAPGPIGAFVVL